MRASEPHYLLFCEADQTSTPGGGRTGRWRFVLESLDGGERLEASDEEPTETGPRMDLLALVRGLEALDQPSRVTLVTGSRYVSHGLKYGLNEWRRNHWRWERFGKMAKVRDCDLWKRIDRAMGYHTVQCRTWRFDGTVCQDTASVESPEAESPVARRRESVEGHSAGEGATVSTRSKESRWPRRWRPVARISHLIRNIVESHDPLFPAHHTFAP